MLRKLKKSNHVFLNQLQKTNITSSNNPKHYIINKLNNSKNHREITSVESMTDNSLIEDKTLLNFHGDFKSYSMIPLRTKKKIISNNVILFKGFRTNTLPAKILKEMQNKERNSGKKRKLIGLDFPNRDVFYQDLMNKKKEINSKLN